MSIKYPVIAVTGSSGAGTTTVRGTFEYIFRREKVNAAWIEGDAFHRYDRAGMRKAIAQAEDEGGSISHFGPEGNLLGKLEATFSDYGKTGRGKTRRYIHDDEEAERYGGRPGTFTEWEELPRKTDLLFYEGLHGGYMSDEINIARHVDLLVGVVPVVNLEWIQKIHRDMHERGHELKSIQKTILRRMPDYVYHITPQFSRTDINFQRVPLVDTSNPFIARDIPSTDESKVVVRFRYPKGMDFPYLLSIIAGSYMSRFNTLVIPGGRFSLAMTLILTPRIQRLIERKRASGWHNHETSGFPTT